MLFPKGEYSLFYTMHKHLSIVAILFLWGGAVWAQIDMQAPVMSDAGLEAYNTYKLRQKNYYTGNCVYDSLVLLDGEALFARLNTLMGATNKIAQSSYSYGALRTRYFAVDRDLNNASNIITFYDGASIDGTWDSGKTWNREHVWPQSQGVSSSFCMGYDMHSVRPARTEVNSGHGSTCYGENYGWDPDDVGISNPNYNSIHNASYHGDVARILLYNYINYGKMGSASSDLYNGAAQLPNKAGSLYESLSMLIAWHLNDVPSLTEMTRNDGAQSFQGNRNPFIDFPDLALRILRGSLTTYSVTYSGAATMNPAYTLVTSAGAVCYLRMSKGVHPSQVEVTGAQYTYDTSTGRLALTNVNQAVTITVKDTPTDLLDAAADVNSPSTKQLRNGHIVIIRNGQTYSLTGQRLQ